jgi:ankyrin repeat protein
MVKLLLDNKAELEDKLLFKTESFPLFQYLLKKAENPKATDEYGESLLHRQCRNGNLKNVQYLIENDFADVSAKNKKGQTPLHLACAGNQPLKMKIVKFLIEEQKADSAITCNAGKAAVHYSAENGLLSVLRYLVEEKKADPAAACNEGKTALHYAAESRDLNVLRYLIEEQKLDIEATENNGRTVLHMACQSNSKLYWPIQKYLIEEHPKIIEAKDKKGKTALQYCLENFEKQKELKLKFFRPIALVLFKKDLLKRENKEIDPIFDWIKQSYDSGMEKSKNQDEIISCLISAITWFQAWLAKKEESLIQYNPLLLIASYCNRVDIAEYLFNQDLCYIEKHSKGEEPDSKRKLLLKSYLKFSCEYGFLDLTRALLQEINASLKDHNFNFDGSLLKTACKNKHITVFKYLLKDEKAKDEAAKFLKDFPLHYACKYGSLEMVRYLFETKSLDVEAKDNDGQTPLSIALHTGSIRIVHYLIEEKNASTDCSYKHGRNVFLLACYFGSIENVKYISQKTKPDVNVQDENGMTALHFACKKENLKLVKFLIIDMKSNLHSVNKEGRTPLHVACESYWPAVPISKFLVNQGADLLAKDKSGKIPLEVAKNQIQIVFLKAAIKR